jgi:hypothetical protein
MASPISQYRQHFWRNMELVINKQDRRQQIHPDVLKGVGQVRMEFDNVFYTGTGTLCTLEGKYFILSAAHNFWQHDDGMTKFQIKLLDLMTNIYANQLSSFRPGGSHPAYKSPILADAQRQ